MQTQSNFRICLKLAGVLCLSWMVLLSACKKSDKGTPTANAQGLSPDSGSAGSVLTLQGSGLANIKSIMFSNDSVPAPFNINFNTNTAIIFTVPDTAVGGKQNVIFTNYAGQQLVVPFNVIALPTVTAAMPYEFVQGSQITLTGNNLDNVSAVSLHGSGIAATIVSQSRSSLVITMPTTTQTKAQLDITNASGTITTSQVFYCIPNNYVFYADDSYGAVVQNWSWATCNVYTGNAIVGNTSLQVSYGAGGGQALSFEMSPAVNCGLYSACVFWVLGGSASEQIYVQTENGGGTTTITVPAKVWTYFKLPISGSWLGSNNSDSRFDFQINGPTATDVLYFDDIMFVY